MNLDVIATNAAMALLTSVAFLWLFRLSTLAARVGARLFVPAKGPRCDLVNGPGQRYADALRDSRTLLLQYNAAGLVFAVVLALLHVLGDGHVNALPHWQAIGVVLLVCALIATGLARAIWLGLTSRRLRFARDAQFVAADRLRYVCGDRGHVFHDVPASAGGADTVDHVLIGVHGLYAVQTINVAPRGSGIATVSDGVIGFNGDAKSAVELEPYAERIRRLQHRLSKQLGRMITLRSVIAVPGWQIQGQADGTQLVVNHRNIGMLRGWRDAREFLMDEDADTLQRWCEAQCLRYPPRNGTRGLQTEAINPAA